MVEVYGLRALSGFCIGKTEYEKIHIGTYTRQKASEIILCRDFINRWNMNHIEKIEKLIFELED